MTNEEARDQIVIFMCDEQKVINDRDKQALDMAIKALEQKPCNTDTCKVVKVYMNEWDKPITAEPKTGHWIEKDGFDGDVYYDCSECGESWTTIEGTPWQNGMNYCPNCGARMVGNNNDR